MPWTEVSIMEQRREFAVLAQQEGMNRRALCRRFGISPSTGYKWISRAAAVEGPAAQSFADRSRRPKTSPRRTPQSLEQAVLGVRDAHPAWGARKIARCLEREGIAAPAASTIHAILQRHGRVVTGGQSTAHTGRFEKDAPNLLWQMDFKGHVPLERQGRLHPLTVIDDHSRYATCLAACGDEKGATVRKHLTATFRRYGLPDAVYVDNGSPWGGLRENQQGGQWTPLRVWLLKLGVRMIYATPWQPQGRGKNERFHRTLNAEVMALQRFQSLQEAQRAFDVWRAVYNLDRPHEALGQRTPAERYRPSSREMPTKEPRVVYDEGEITRSVRRSHGKIGFMGRKWAVPRAFHGERLAIRPTGQDGIYGLYFASYRVGEIDLTTYKPVRYVSEQVSTISPG